MGNTTSGDGGADDAADSKRPDVVSRAAEEMRQRVEVKANCTAAAGRTAVYLLDGKQGDEFQTLLAFWQLPEGHTAYDYDVVKTCLFNIYRHRDFGKLERLTALQNALRHADLEAHFFSALLPFIIHEATQLPARLKANPIPLLRASSARIDSEMARIPDDCLRSIMAALFLVVLPPPDLGETDPADDRYSTFPTAVHSGIFESVDVQSEIGKMECLLRYWNRVHRRVTTAGDTAAGQGGLIVYRLRKPALDDAAFAAAELSEVVLEHKTAIEDVPDAAFADFANRSLSGGYFNYGNVQEELMFSYMPELSAAAAVCEVMLENEAIAICGAARVASHTGYGISFTCTGDFDDTHPELPEDGMRKTAVLAFDAVHFIAGFGGEVPRSHQWRKKWIDRELVKAACAFQPLPDARFNFDRIATGKWGCGLFNGDVQLKFVVQWLAASLAKRTMVFCTFGGDGFEDAGRLVEVLRAKHCTVGVVYAYLKSLHGAAPKKGDLFAALIRHVDQK